MRILLLLTIFLLSLSISAQKKYSFSNRDDKFLFEYQEFMSMKVSKDTKKKVEDQMLIIAPFWNSDTLSKKEKMSIISMCNLMIGKRFNAHPSFEYLMDNILAVKRDQVNKDIFDDWFTSIGYYVKKRRKGYLHRYFQASTRFFNTHYIHDKSKKVWKISNPKVRIEIIDNKPIYSFDTVNLVGTTGKDSTYIWQTTGSYYPLQEKWVGHGGKVFWTRVSFEESTVWAKLRDYKISLKSALWTADSVMFYDRRNFSYGLMGSFKDKYSYSKQDSNARYPAFSSYRHDLSIKDIYENVDYLGGYALNGRSMIGSAEGKNRAYFIFKHGEKKFVYAGARTFVIQRNRILSEKVTVTIYLESVDTITGEKTIDSIYHPGLSLYYSDTKKHLSIYRKDAGMAKTPFSDSYHKVDLYVEELNWKLGEDYIDMKSIQQKGIESRAYFESENYFSISRYKILQGLDRRNPVEAVNDFTEQQGFDEFYAEDFGNYMRMSKESTIAYLLNLASKGFLLYDFDDDYVYVKPSVKVYVMAHRGEVDYDVISFKSYTNGIIPNASLNLTNNDIILQGIGMVHLSDSQDVQIIPRHGRVVLKKNRDFLFAGKIMAGRFDIHARDVYFSYDKFKLDMPHIDSLRFKVESFEENDYGEHPLVRVKNVIQNLNGYILIDHPNNKSGREGFAEYPILNSKSRSYVYYDKAEIYDRVYNRDKFFYRLESFVIDSLDDFKTEGLKFEGYLSSGGIFPDIDDPLIVMPDYSLGFITNTGTAGMSVYGGVGRFTDTIRLSNEGLRGSGKLNYLTSTGNSDDFILFPDSTNAILQTYDIKEVKSGTEYPPVITSNVDMHWEPYNDVMHVYTRNEDEPFNMYDTEAVLLGNLSLSSKELEGGGLISIKNAEMEADTFNFKNRTYASAACMFRLKTFVDVQEDNLDDMDSFEDKEEFAFSTQELFIAKVDFDKRRADFESTTGAKLVEFKENLYMCFMDKFTWYMDEDKTEFSAKEDPMALTKGKNIREISDMALNGTQFISTHPDQDKLNFMSQRGVYSQRKKLIHAFGVPMLTVADAVIIPGNNEIKVYTKADMEEITDAELLVNIETKYHTIKSGVFKVRGKHSYSGRGTYDYKDEDGWVQNIFFDKIEVDTAGFTVGYATIKNEDNFSLSRYFEFAGDVTIVGVNKYLNFNGGTKINHKCDTLEHSAIAFEANIDPVNIEIPIDENIQTVEGFRVYSGLKSKVNNGQVYSVFLSEKGSRTDNIVMQSSGKLIFDKISQEYRIASEEKLSQRSLPGNYLSLSRRNCVVYAEGELNIVFNTGHVQATTYGKARYYTKLDSSAFSISIPLNFHFNEDALEMMAMDLNDRMGLGAIDLENDVYKVMLNNKLGQEMSDNLSSKIITNGGEYRKVPKELLSTIFISDVRMKFNPRTRSFVSIGDIGIASLGKYQVLKYVPGKLEILNKKGRFVITIAFDLGSKEYYYFEIKGNNTAGQVLAYSSNKEFVRLIKESKSDDRKFKAKGKQPKFNYYLSTPIKFKKFMRMMKMKE
ncbi:MAG: hypothetical protein B6I18_02640 [Bacteroidetes bacterium 4572_112]|nr:MAG: hypothetical protein B6I18_02640 [Bacteroidetes bacterium 4572_112]